MECFQLSIVEVCPEVQPRSDVITLTVNEKMFECYWLHSVHKASHISNIESTVCLSRKAKMVNNGGLTSVKIPFHNSLDSLKPLYSLMNLTQHRQS